MTPYFEFPIFKLTVNYTLGVYVHLHHEQGMKGDKPCYVQMTVKVYLSLHPYSSCVQQCHVTFRWG
jgi:hypothetical protein